MAGRRRAWQAIRVIAAIALLLPGLGGAGPVGAAEGDPSFSGTMSLHRDDVGCEWAHVPDTTGTIAFTIGPTGALEGTFKGTGSDVRNLACAATGVSLTRTGFESYTAEFTGTVDLTTGALNATGTMHGVDEVTDRNCSDTSGPYTCDPEIYRPTWDLPVSVTGTFDLATGRGSGEIVDLSKFPAKGQWSASGAPLGCPAPAASAAGLAMVGAMAANPIAAPVAALGACVDLRVDRIEVVQVVQDAEGTIPLVAGKQTIARVFVRYEADPPRTVTGVTAFLRAFRGTSELPGGARVLNEPVTAQLAPLREQTAAAPATAAPATAAPTLVPQPSVSAAASPAIPTGAERDWVVATGTVRRGGGAGTLDPATIVRSGLIGGVIPAAGDQCVAFLGASGTKLGDGCFPLAFADAAGNALR